MEVVIDKEVGFYCSGLDFFVTVAEGVDEC